MSITSLDAFDTTLQETNRYLKIAMRELGTDDRRIALSALRATLHALRDHLDVMSVAHLGAQLPMLLRGVYYEGWRPVEVFAKERHLADFLAHIEALLPARLKGYPEESARAGFAALAECIDLGEADKVMRQLPHELRELWPQLPVERQSA